MLNPKYQKYADRIRQLLDEVPKLRGLPSKSSDYEPGQIYHHGPQVINLWYTQVLNILRVVVGIDSEPYQRIVTNSKLLSGLDRYIRLSHIEMIAGVLAGVLNDLEDGLLQKQEFLIATEVFDSILDQAKHLNDAGYKDPGAVLVRVVVEDALKRLSTANNVFWNDKTKASMLNLELRKLTVYNQPRWRQIDGWLDIGNAAAHGKFNEYTAEQVSEMIDSVTNWLAGDFGS